MHHDTCDMIGHWVFSLKRGTRFSFHYFPEQMIFSKTTITAGKAAKYTISLSRISLWIVQIGIWLFIIDPVFAVERLGSGSMCSVPIWTNGSVKPVIHSSRTRPDKYVWVSPPPVRIMGQGIYFFYIALATYIYSQQ